MTRFQKFSLVVLLGLGISVAAILQNYQTMSVLDKESKFQTVAIGPTTIRAELMNTLFSRTRGLSGRTSLREGDGMLFVFDTEDRWGFWMKDMHFPIDIIWADKEGTIITIKKDATPQSYPETFYPARPAQYVLEVPAGFVNTHGIAEGMKVVLE